MIPWFKSPSLPLGPVTIHAFGVLVALGILVGARLTRKRGEELGLEPEMVAQMVTTILVCGFIFAHIFDVFAYQTKGPRPTLWEILNPFGGLSSYGGFIGALAGLFYWCWRHKQKVMPYADSLGYGLAAGWTFGRFGCFTAHDHPGHLTDFWLAVQYPEGARHDLGLYEALWALGVTLMFLALSRWKKQPLGLYVGLLTTLYGPVRFLLDFLRATDVAGADPRYGGLTPAQWLSVAVTFVGLGLLGWTWKNAQKAA
jgi:phosphatidylglycerol:prolipoprotein diacylglycerol transferase